jgi:hypothetical protein
VPQLPGDGTLESLVVQRKSQPGKKMQVRPHGRTDQRKKGGNRPAIKGAK